ncbi:MAG: hypothetical protein EBX69_05590 [Betaproteobacteria bacterium]|nr:hypothetical protein [Betaproteobacteria bacterium]
MEHNADRLSAVVDAVGPVQWVGSGLGAALGYWLGCRREGAIRQAELFEPFLGFNVPFYGSTRSGKAAWASAALSLARHEWGAMLGLLFPPPSMAAPRKQDLVPCRSWQEVACFTDSLDFVQLSVHYGKETRVWLNRSDQDLQADRAANHIRAMSPNATVEIGQWQSGAFPDALVETMGAKGWV